MFPGTNLPFEVAEELYLRFNDWADHFQDCLRKGGVDYLIEGYKKNIQYIEKVDRWMRRVQSGSPLRHKNLYAFFVMDLEYWNNISCRYALEIITEYLDERDLPKLREQLFPLDERLKRLLKERSPDGKDDYPPLIGQPVEQYWFARALPRCAEWCLDDEEASKVADY